MIHDKERIRTQIKIRNLPERRENTTDQVAFSFRFASDLLKGWREISGPIIGLRKAKTVQSRAAQRILLNQRFIRCTI